MKPMPDMLVRGESGIEKCLSKWTLPMSMAVSVILLALQLARSTPVPPSSLPVPAPTGLRMRRLDAQRVRLTWNNMGPGYRYNLYSACPNPPYAYEIENTAPFLRPQAYWVGPDMPEDILLVVTAIDQNNHESSYSNPVEWKGSDHSKP